MKCGCPGRDVLMNCWNGTSRGGQKNRQGLESSQGVVVVVVVSFSFPHQIGVSLAIILVVL